MPQTKITTKGSFTGITLASMRNYLKFELTDAVEDALITSMIAAAVERVEKYCNILLRVCTVEAIFDDFEVSDERAGGSVLLPCIPCISVTSVNIIDSQGTATDETSFLQKGSQLKEVICPNYKDGDNLKIVFQAGYGGESQESIPEIAIQVIYKLVGRMYEQRGSEEPLSGDERKDLNKISFNAWI